MFHPMAKRHARESEPTHVGCYFFNGLLARVNDVAEEEARATRTMLDGEEEWMVHFYFDRRRALLWNTIYHHRNSRGGSFGAFLIQLQECLVKDVRNEKRILRHAIEVGLERIKGGLHAECFQRIR